MHARILTILSVAVLVSACSSDDGEANDERGAGTLAVDVSGLPDGASAAVVVTGPGGFAAAIAATQSLPVAAGTYTVTAADVRGGGMTWVATVAGSPATVSPGGTTEVSVAYGAAGTLALVIAGLPADAIPAIEVTGPAGFHHVAAGSEVLEGLRPGTYRLTAEPVDSGSSIVPTRWRVASGSPATVEIVAGGLARSRVGFQKVPGTGRLWVSSYYDTGTDLAGALHGIAGTELEGGPADRIHLVTDAGVDALALDRQGDLWVANQPRATVQRIAAASLEASGTASPVVTFTVEDGAGIRETPIELAFDAEGDLWVAFQGEDCVVEIAAADLTSSGTKTPAVEVCGLGYQGGDFAFDEAGNLWVTESLLGNAVRRVPAEALGASGTVTPDVVLSTAGFAPEPHALALDRDGSLVVGGGNGASQGIGRFAPDQLVSGGTAARQIATGRVVTSMALDHAGWLWFLSFAQGEELRALSPETLVAPPTVSTAAVPGLRASMDLAFSPPVPGLPLAR